MLSKTISICKNRLVSESHKGCPISSQFFADPFLPLHSSGRAQPKFDQNAHYSHPTGPLDSPSMTHSRPNVMPINTATGGYTSGYNTSLPANSQAFRDPFGRYQHDASNPYRPNMSGYPNSAAPMNGMNAYGVGGNAGMMGGGGAGAMRQQYPRAVGGGAATSGGGAQSQNMRSRPW